MAIFGAVVKAMEEEVLEHVLVLGDTKANVLVKEYVPASRVLMLQKFAGNAVAPLYHTNVKLSHLLALRVVGTS